VNSNGLIKYEAHSGAMAAVCCVVNHSCKKYTEVPRLRSSTGPGL